MLLRTVSLLLLEISFIGQVSVTNGIELYEILEDELETPQWLEKDSYDVSREITGNDAYYNRYPNKEQRYHMSNKNEELKIISSENHQFVPEVAKVLQMNKQPVRFFQDVVFKPYFASGVKSRHRFAEGAQLRKKNLGLTDETIIPFLYMPTGWPLFLICCFAFAVFLVPFIGSILITRGLRISYILNNFVLEPIRFCLRQILIRHELYNQKWTRYLAPSYFLEPRQTWKVPKFLRRHELEDIPPELAYKPPINKIDYTMYILAQHDYDEHDLDMDELEYIDEMLQFRDENPKIVARLLKHKLGDEKFDYFFEEDILSDDDEDVELPPPPAPDAPSEADAGVMEEDEKKKLKKETEYEKIIGLDEPWMHQEFDSNFGGSEIELEEVRKRRRTFLELKEQIIYLHNLLESTESSQFVKKLTHLSPEERKKMQDKLQRMLQRYLRYSTKTKQRIQDIEPRSGVQNLHNVALSKYLPLITEMSHFNHRLNLKHEKKKDPQMRKQQLELFGGP